MQMLIEWEWVHIHLCQITLNIKYIVYVCLVAFRPGILSQIKPAWIRIGFFFPLNFNMNMPRQILPLYF